MSTNHTPNAQALLVQARKEAKKRNQNYIGTEHVLLAILEFQNCRAIQILHSLGMAIEPIRAEVDHRTGSGPEGSSVGNIPYTPRVKKVLAIAEKEAKTLGHVGTEHFLIALAEEGEGVAGMVLKSFLLDAPKLREANKILLGELDLVEKASELPENADYKALYRKEHQLRLSAERRATAAEGKLARILSIGME